jgi:DNA-binding transcriptional ArsR family regulator
MNDKDDTASRLADTDPKLLDFLRTKVSSFVKWDLARFFHDNPHTTDTAENIARYTGRDARSVESELMELARSGVLEVQEVGNLRVYTLATDQDMRALLDRFILACDDRRFRVKAMYQLIRGVK